MAALGRNETQALATVGHGALDVYRRDILGDRSSTLRLHIQDSNTYVHGARAAEHARLYLDRPGFRIRVRKDVDTFVHLGMYTD